MNIDSLLKDGMVRAMSYEVFRELMQELSDTGKTTGLSQTESLIEYTRINNRRLKRWDKTFKLSETARDRIIQLDRKTDWLVLTESWCGDAAPSLPVMNKFAELNPNIRFGILLRDENPELMEYFHTDGALSIPKLIARDRSNGKVLGTWGPRPGKASRLVEEFKTENGNLTAEFREDLQRWYNADKGQNIQEDLLRILTLE